MTSPAPPQGPGPGSSPGGPTLSITRAGPPDAGEILTVQRAAYVIEGQLYDDPRIPPLTETLPELIDVLTDPGITVLAARDAGRLVGSVRLRREGSAWHVGRLSVAPDLQGRGVGTALLAAVEQEAIQQEKVGRATAVPTDNGNDRDNGTADTPSTTLRLFTGARSATNLRLYDRLGYQQVGQETVSTMLTFIYLEKRLRTASAARSSERRCC